MLLLQDTEVGQIEEGDMGRVRFEPGFLGNDDHQPAPGPEVGKIGTEQG